MSKLLSILLLVIFGFSPVLPLLATGTPDDASLPACCRRNGKHHCAMQMNASGTALEAAPTFRAPQQRCPFAPQASLSVHTGFLAHTTQAATALVLMSHPASVAQTECKLRIARDRSRQKRGPPTLTLS